MNILDQYNMNYPSIQNEIDIFKDEWSCAIPGPYTSGIANLFNDSRILDIERAIGGFSGKTILELGPLEAAHTTMMSQRGARSILSIEANSRAFLKCLIVNHILHLHNVTFTMGNFDRYLEQPRSFDFILACGVIYHCENPVKTITNLCKASNTIGIWSHYYVEKEVRQKYGDRFKYDGELIEYEGFRANSYLHSYQSALDNPAFCGGGNPVTRWMDRQSWFGLFAALGFHLEILTESLDHPNGPEFTAVARRV